MATTRQNLDIQSDKVLTEPQIQTRMQMRDAAAVQTLFIDFDEPAGADRTVNFVDPTADDTVAYLNLAQVFQNKQISTVPSAGDDIANKTYVDTAVSGVSPPTATSGSGGATQGILTMDSDKGLLLVGGVAEVKVDGTSIQFDGSGQLSIVGGIIPDATAGPGGGTKGQVTADSDLGLDITTGIMEVKVDASTITFNGLGELTVIGGGGGGPTGILSGGPQFTEEIAAVSPPANGTIAGGDISTLDFEDAVVEGVRFAVVVPDDYFSGNLTFYVVQQMSAADPAGSIEITTQAKIVDVSGGVIDTLTYPETQASHTVPTTTDLERRAFLTITDGDFAAGDTIQVLYKRLGNDVSDLHPGDQRVVNFSFSYTGIINSRVVNQSLKFFENAPGETATTPNTISGGDITTEDFPTAVDTALRFDFTVPDNWDTTSNAELRLTYAMSVSDAVGVVRLERRAKIARATAGSIDTIAASDFDITPGAGASTVPKTTTSIFTIPATSIDPGDVVSIIIARRGTDVVDTHTGSFQLVCAIVTFGTLPPLAAVSAVTIREEYLNAGVFGNATGTVSGDTAFPTLGSDFEAFDSLSSTDPAGQLDVAYEGRLGTLTSAVKEIRFFVKGTGTSPQYTLNIYAEGTGVVHTDGPNAAPVGATEIVKTDLDLSAQPTGSKRFFVVITADIDAGEEVLVSRPFVRLE